MRNHPSLRVALFALLLGVLVACGAKTAPHITGPNVVVMTTGTFMTDHITIAAGDKLIFVNDADTAARHILAIGTNGDLHSQAGAPNFGGAAGVNVGQGAAWTSPAWTTVGTYHITCTIHPMMNLTVTVRPAIQPTATPKSTLLAPLWPLAVGGSRAGLTKLFGGKHTLTGVIPNFKGDTEKLPRHRLDMNLA